MRGGLERWKRGVESQGVRQAMAYAFRAACDAHASTVGGVDALAGYSSADSARVARFVCEDGVVALDALDAEQLRRWVDSRDPHSGEQRGRDRRTSDADLILDGTINAPKSFSIAALLHPELAAEFEALQDRLRDRIITTWQHELNARRGAGGRTRESLARIEVVELRHRRSRALDPHIHRHLWLNVKVLGVDGKWSNIDSRVALKLHTVINAEGELAARTDPEWIHALARHGYTLDASGEIAQLAHVVRPLSRRSGQIEANRTKLLLEWRADHPGVEPSRDILQQIDRRAWALHRPNRPEAVDEVEWEQLVRDELLAIDARLLDPREHVIPASRPLESLDRDLLAAQAIVDADQRSTRSGGRFSDFDIRAGAMRAVAAAGVTATRDDLTRLVGDVVTRAVYQVVDLLDGDPTCPAHIKRHLATETVRLKTELAEWFAALARPGQPASERHVRQLVGDLLGPSTTLDDSQIRAAAAIAGTDSLISVLGPAGAGKTTMLRVARAALRMSGRRMVVVAPTKKAASVAGREVGVHATSLHGFLHDHGWRWNMDPAGATVWTRLNPGDTDPRTGTVFHGPRRSKLRRRDRVVLDEAGMVDLQTARALAIVAAESGVGIAMVGDDLQASPVGHAGALAIMTRHADTVVELTAVHRFRDPTYADLTLRMRHPGTPDVALHVAIELDDRGLIRPVAHAAAARDALADAYFRWSTGNRRVALVTAANEEADAVNDTIQERRITQGDLSTRVIAVGRHGQRILEGDIVQTRRNDTTASVENRAVWVVRHIADDALELESVSDSGCRRQVTAEYASNHVHLAYASTVHGIQGETTDASIVGPGVDAAGLYVGMTRGRIYNEAIVIARTTDDAKRTLANSMSRGIPEVTREDAERAAREELSRAARDPDAADWRDAARRPFGRVVNPEATASRLARQLEKLEAARARSNDWITAARRALADANVTRTGLSSVSRGLQESSEGSRDTSADSLRSRLADRLREHASIEIEAATTAMAIDDHRVEESIRRNLPPAIARREQAARDAARMPVGASRLDRGQHISR